MPQLVNKFANLTEPHLTWRLKKMAAFAKGKILDVGFADLPNSYLKGQVIGLDLQRTVCPANYKATVASDIMQHCFAPASFDTIVAGEIIEHIDKPIHFLRESRTLLKTGGHLIISTPNPYYPPIILLNWLMIRKFFYSPHHTFEVAPRYMVRLLERANFSLIDMISGGMLLPVGKKRHLTVPVPRSICYHMIYAAKAI